MPLPLVREICPLPREGLLLGENYSQVGTPWLGKEGTGQPVGIATGLLSLTEQKRSCSKPTGNEEFPEHKHGGGTWMRPWPFRPHVFMLQHPRWALEVCKEFLILRYFVITPMGTPV